MTTLDRDVAELWSEKWQALKDRQQAALPTAERTNAIRSQIAKFLEDFPEADGISDRDAAPETLRALRGQLAEALDEHKHVARQAIDLMHEEQVAWRALEVAGMRRRP